MILSFDRMNNDSIKFGQKIFYRVNTESKTEFEK